MFLIPANNMMAHFGKAGFHNRKYTVYDALHVFSEYNLRHILLVSSDTFLVKASLH